MIRNSSIPALLSTQGKVGDIFEIDRGRLLGLSARKVGMTDVNIKVVCMKRCCDLVLIRSQCTGRC